MTPKGAQQDNTVWPRASGTASPVPGCEGPSPDSELRHPAEGDPQPPPVGDNATWPTVCLSMRPPSALFNGA